MIENLKLQVERKPARKTTRMDHPLIGNAKKTYFQYKWKYNMVPVNKNDSC